MLWRLNHTETEELRELIDGIRYDGSTILLIKQNAKLTQQTRQPLQTAVRYFEVGDRNSLIGRIKCKRDT